ncbi:hypothetical protein C8J57DRAFT_1504806 [Mycena rebaudengoi]|nr:hypothetical protein C8J57DRAFT_1504806 [Mycena rebaudengoi]
MLSLRCAPPTGTMCRVGLMEVQLADVGLNGEDVHRVPVTKTVVLEVQLADVGAEAEGVDLDLAECDFMTWTGLAWFVGIAQPIPFSVPAHFADDAVLQISPHKHLERMLGMLLKPRCLELDATGHRARSSSSEAVTATCMGVI